VLPKKLSFDLNGVLPSRDYPRSGERMSKEISRSTSLGLTLDAPLG
jgi:hypothetical protein